MTDDDVITASEAARIARVAYTTIQKAILSGRLKAQKRATIWMVDPGSLEEYARQAQERKAKRRP